MVRTVISGAPATMAGLIGLPVVGSERRPPRSRRCHQWAGPQGQPWVGIILRAMLPTCVCRTVNGALNPPCQRITSGSPYTHPSRHSSGRRQATSAWRSTAGSGFHRVVLLHQIPPCYLAEKILVTALIHLGGISTSPDSLDPTDTHRARSGQRQFKSELKEPRTPLCCNHARVCVALASGMPAKRAISAG